MPVVHRIPQRCIGITASWILSASACLSLDKEEPARRAWEAAGTLYRLPGLLPGQLLRCLPSPETSFWKVERFLRVQSDTDTLPVRLLLPPGMDIPEANDKMAEIPGIPGFCCICRRLTADTPPFHSQIRLREWSKIQGTSGFWERSDGQISSTETGSP